MMLILTKKTKPNCIVFLPPSYEHVDTTVPSPWRMLKAYLYSIGSKKKMFRNETEDQVKGLIVRGRLENS